jgi:hypothetical protein
MGSPVATGGSTVRLTPAARASSGFIASITSGHGDQRVRRACRAGTTLVELLILLALTGALAGVANERKGALGGLILPTVGAHAALLLGVLFGLPMPGGIAAIASGLALAGKAWESERKLRSHPVYCLWKAKQK